MSTRMLIDARHPEETRVAVVKGNRIEEFDFESAEKKQLKGNIYLAKVTRVEPSLQAAFIEYGGNRHGFLAFSEIHPDYYQIPKEDREALLREEREAHEAHHDDHDDHHDDEHAEAAPEGEPGEDGEAHPPEETGGHEESANEALRKKRMNLRRRYKIQEVIHRRQVLLVQVVKEERGNKGAALTTYLSLAGRYCVLMPNTGSGGGISRKISNQADRKRLKSIMTDLALPSSMACIVRTAGLSRTKAEIKRDFDYLTRLWDGIRDVTLKSTAPALIHQDSDLIKRAIRDIYSRDVEQVLVEGEEGYKAAKGFMKLLMPSHATKVQQYVDPIPLYQRCGVEGQLAAMYNPVVQLRSGGYLVINPTEALVSIDINSGRSTREHDIEGTALKTNMEAADEIARQLRLRDMAGLVVIDFIDMEVNSNNRKVERQMKEALKNDRARIQIGRISSFGLMEMSRQRLRTGVLEASTHVCPMCEGAAVVRSVPSASLAALRALEEEALRGKHSLFTLRAAEDVAIYILNRKRDELVDLEARYGVAIDVAPDSDLLPPRFIIDADGAAPSRPIPAPGSLPAPVAIEEDEEEVVETADYEDEEEEAREPRAPREPREPRAAGDEGGERGRGRRRRRRRGGGGRGEGEAREGAPEPAEPVEAAEGEEAPVAGETEAQRNEEEVRRRRRRGRRGGRRRDGGAADGAPFDEAAGNGVISETEPLEPAAEAAPAEEPVETPVAEAAPKRRRSRKADVVAEPVAEVEAPPAPAAEPEAVDAPKPKAKRAPRRKAAVEPESPPEPQALTDAETPEPEASVVSAGTEAEPANDAEPRDPRKGWWSRTFGA